VDAALRRAEYLGLPGFARASRVVARWWDLDRGARLWRDQVDSGSPSRSTRRRSTGSSGHGYLC